MNDSRSLFPHSRLREAATRWMPGVDFGPDLLRQAADEIDRLRDTLALIAGITESPLDEIVRVQLHNAQRLAKEAIDA